MSDVFISYSRLDREFVGQLREALAAEDQNVWIDWEDIPPSQAWWGEIQKGIAKANNFVMILSPQSMASPICQMELEYARALGKRIIPVLYRDYQRDEAIAAMATRLAKPEQDATRELWGARQPHDVFDGNDSVLKHINYFFFRPEDDFANTFAGLLEVIRTDYHHKERHTTLALRAREWDRRERDAGFLLLGNELAEAQAWLGLARELDPKPTLLQEEYISASRQRNRQLRNIRRASVVGSVMAVLALIFAIGASIMGVQATDNLNGVNTQAAVVEAQIEANQNRLESLRLAREAANIQSGPAMNPEVAMLLGIRALRTAYTAEADAVLVQATDSFETVDTLQGLTTRPGAFTLSPDGQTMVIVQAGNLSLWTARPQNLMGEFPVAGSIFEVAMSKDQNFIATGESEGQLLLWDAQTGERLREFVGHTDSIASIAFSWDGQRLISAASDGIRLWDVASGEELKFYPQADTASLAFYPDGQSIVTASSDSTLHWWDLSTEETILTFSNDRPLSAITHLVFDADGHTLLSSESGFGDANTLRLWNTRTGQTSRVLTGHANLVHAGALTDAGMIVSISEDGTIRWWVREVEDLIAMACDLVVRDFKNEERRLYGILDDEPTCP